MNALALDLMLQTELPAATRGTLLPTIPGRVPELADLGEGCAFAPRCDRAIDDCRRAPPPAVEVGASHAARCIRIEEGRP